MSACSVFFQTIINQLFPMFSTVHVVVVIIAPSSHCVGFISLIPEWWGFLPNPKARTLTACLPVYGYPDRPQSLLFWL